jgi:hypothetical protein
MALQLAKTNFNTLSVIQFRHGLQLFNRAFCNERRTTLFTADKFVWKQSALLECGFCDATHVYANAVLYHFFRSSPKKTLSASSFFLINYNCTHSPISNLKSISHPCLGSCILNLGNGAIFMDGWSTRDCQFSNTLNRFLRLFSRVP